MTFVATGGNPFAGMFSIDPNATPEDLRRKRAAILAASPTYGRAATLGEGLGQLAFGIGAGIKGRKMDKLEGEKQAQADAFFNALMGRMTTTPSTMGGPMTILGPRPVDEGPVSADPNSPAQLGLDTMKAIGKVSPYSNAIAGVESAGDYQAVGPVTKSGDRAYGKHQVMGANIPEWTKAATGIAMTPEQYLNDPGAQEATFNNQFGGYVDQYGNPQDAASMWFSGRPMDKAGNASDGYTTVPQYVAQFDANMGTDLPLQAPASNVTMSTSGGPSGAPSLNELYAAMSNPWLSENERAVVSSLIAQQQQSTDPLYQLQLQKAQADLAAAQNGPDLPAQFQSLDLQAQAAGLKPGTKDYQDFMLNGGVAKDSTPASFQSLDLQAKAAGFTPGTPEYQQFMATQGAGLVAAAKTEGEAAATAKVGLDDALAKSDETLNLIDQISNDPALGSITGNIQGNMWAGLSGGQAGTDLNIKIENLKSKLFMEAFQSLKGGGAITETEGAKATAALANLDRAQSFEAFQAALADLRSVLKAGQERAKNKAGAAPTTAPAAPPAANVIQYDANGNVIQ